MSGTNCNAPPAEGVAECDKFCLADAIVGMTAVDASKMIRSGIISEVGFIFRKSVIRLIIYA